MEINVLDEIFIPDMWAVSFLNHGSELLSLLVLHTALLKNMRQPFQTLPESVVYLKTNVSATRRNTMIGKLTATLSINSLFNSMKTLAY